MLSLLNPIVGKRIANCSTSVLSYAISGGGFVSTSARKSLSRLPDLSFTDLAIVTARSTNSATYGD